MIKIKDFKKFESRVRPITESVPQTNSALKHAEKCWVILDDAGDVQWVQIHMEEEEKKQLEAEGFYVDKHDLVHR